MNYRRLEERDRAAVLEFLMEHWHGTTMVIRAQEVDMREAEGFLCVENGAFLGLLTYAVKGDTLEILSLDSLRENQGIGSALVNLAVQEARVRKCRRVVLITTNDNIRALRFYQRRGFDMSNFYRNAMELARKLKPGIPMIGENQIPLRHEIEFEMNLQ